jgi:dihydropyrimidine dehydrogenase (NADP+)
MFIDWNGQAPPTPKHQNGKILQVQDLVGKHLPNFGEFKNEINKIKQSYYKNNDNNNEIQNQNKATNLNVIESFKVSKVKDLIGSALNKIGNYGDLNNKEQVVALIDEEMCINCGNL